MNENKDKPRAIYALRPELVQVEMKNTPVSRNSSTANIPKGRSGHRVAANDYFLYAYGGYNPTNAGEDDPAEHRLFREMWRFNILMKSWEKMAIDPAAFPKELVSLVMIMRGNNVIIHGGTGFPFGESCSDNVYMIDLIKPRIRMLSVNGSLPEPLYGQGAAFDSNNDFIYVVGGTSGREFMMDVYKFNVSNNVWETLARDMRDSPGGRYRHEIAVLDDKIYVFGGGTLNEVYGFKDLPCFDVNSRMWSLVKTIGFVDTLGRRIWPHRRRCHSGVMSIVDDEDPMYIISGGFDGVRSFKDIWTLNFKTMAWKRWSNTLPSTLYFHDAALTPQGKMIIFGGISGCVDNSDILNPTVDRTNQVLSCWIRVPKLVDISWEALVHYCPQLLHSHPISFLYKLGIPSNFINRIFPIK